MRPPIFEKNSR